MTAVVRITVEDLATGEKETQEVEDNDYFILTTGRAEVSNTQVYPQKGTHVVTVRGLKRGWDTKFRAPK